MCGSEVRFMADGISRCFEIFSIFKLKICIFRLKICIFSLEICIFNLKIEILAGSFLFVSALFQITEVGQIA